MATAVGTSCAGVALLHAPTVLATQRAHAHERPRSRSSLALCASYCAHVSLWWYCTEYNLLVFSDVVGSHGWIWEYYAPASCHFIHNSAHGQKRPGLIKNATYLGRTVLNNGISNEVS